MRGYRRYVAVEPGGGKSARELRQLLWTCFIAVGKQDSGIVVEIENFARVEPREHPRSRIIGGRDACQRGERE